MSKKQTNGLIVAAVIFVIVGIISVITNTISSKSSILAVKADRSSKLILRE